MRRSPDLWGRLQRRWCRSEGSGPATAQRVTISARVSGSFRSGLRQRRAARPEEVQALNPKKVRTRERITLPRVSAVRPGLRCQ